MNLFDFSDYLISRFGLVNAINLDGGGSASVDINGIVTNYPSDFCNVDDRIVYILLLGTIVYKKLFLPRCLPSTVKAISLIA